MPFKCSTHFVTDTHKLQLMATEPTRFGMQPHKFNGAFTQPLPLRTHSFLSDSRTDPAIKSSIVNVHIGDGSGSSSGGSGTGDSDNGGGTGRVSSGNRLILPRGATNVQVQSTYSLLHPAILLSHDPTIASSHHVIAPPPH